MTKTKFTAAGRDVDGIQFLILVLLFLFLVVATVFIGGAVFAFVYNEWIVIPLGLSLPVISWQQGVLVVIAIKIIAALAKFPTFNGSKDG